MGRDRCRRTGLLAALLPVLLCGLVLWTGTGPSGGAVPTAAASAAPGTLRQPPSPRRYGLPVALAVVALVGSGSLLLRTLLAEPRRPSAVDDGGDDPQRW